MKRYRHQVAGLKLIELIVALAIIALLVSITLSVVVEVRRRAYEPPCMANLRQIWVAFHNYREDYGNSYPLGFMEMRPYLREIQILKCPRDDFGGVNRGASSTMGIPVSYYYMPDDALFRKLLLELDPQHGIVYCLLHGRSRLSREALADPHNQPAYLTAGTVLRLRVEGSIQRAQVNFFCYRDNLGGFIQLRHPWHLLTDVRPCPVEICWGAHPDKEVPCPMFW